MSPGPNNQLIEPSYQPPIQIPAPGAAIFVETESDRLALDTTTLEGKSVIQIQPSASLYVFHENYWYTITSGGGDGSYPTLYSSDILNDSEVDGETVQDALTYIINNQPSGGGVENVTYSEISASIAAGTLVPGQQYIITDFQLMWWNNDETAVTPSVLSSSVIEPLMIQATTTSSLSPIAQSTLHPDEIVHYDATATYSNTWSGGDPIEGFKGWISRRIDLKKNVNIPWDYRYITTTGYILNFDSIPEWDSEFTYNKFNFVEDTPDTIVRRTGVGIFYSIVESNLGSYPESAPNTWMKVVADGPNIFSVATISTLYNDAVGSSVQLEASQSMQVPTITDLNYDLNIDDMLNIYIKSGRGNIIFGAGFKNNEIGENFENNTIRSSFSDNKIGTNFSENIIHDGFSRNQIGNSSDGSIINESFTDNKIGNSFYNNQIAENSNGNDIGNGFDTNTMGRTFSNNIIGDEFNSNFSGFFFRTNRIGNNFNYNNLSNYFENNKTGKNFQENSILARTFSNNTIGDDFQLNTVGQYFGPNTIGDTFQENTIGEYAYYNDFGNDFVGNTIGDNFNNNNVSNAVNGLNFSSATFVYLDYEKTIYKRPDGAFKLSYMSDLDVLTVVDPIT